MPGLAALGAVVPLAAAIAFFTPVVKNGIAQSEVSSPLYIVLVMAPAVVGLIALRGTRAAAAAAAGCGLISLGVFVAVTELSRVSEGFIEVSTGYVFWTFSAGAAFILFLLVGATGPTPTDRLGDGTVMGTTLFGLVAVVGAGIPPDGSPDWWTWFTSDGQGWLTILNPLFVGGLLLATVLVAATRTRVAAAFAFGLFGSLSFGWAWAVGDFEEVTFSGLSFNSGAEIALGIGLVGAAAFAAFGALAEGPVDGPTNPAWAAVAIIAVVGLGLLAVVRDDESLEERCAGGDFDACDELFFSLPADGPVEVTTPPTR